MQMVLNRTAMIGIGAPFDAGAESRVVIITGDGSTSVPKIADTATKSAGVELAAITQAARD